MTTLRYNPLTYSETLKKNGMDSRLANVIAQNQAEFVSGILNDTMATKDDIKEIKNEIRIAFKELELKITLRMGGMFIAMITVLQLLKIYT